MPLQVTIGVRCALGVGPERGGRHDNQDNFLVAEGNRIRFLGTEGRPDEVAARGHGVLVAVADGMGGHDDGDIASSTAVRALAARWLDELDASGPEHALRQWVPGAHDRIRAQSLAEGRTNMGTTLTALWLAGPRAGWAQVGDSRLYQRRGSRVRLLTRDQTHAEFARRDGRPPNIFANYLAQTFIFGSRGIGEDGHIRMDSGVDTGTVKLVEQDRFLLCSDGVSGFLPEDELDALLIAGTDAQETADALLAAAIASGSSDNLTAVVVDIVEVPGPLTDEGDGLWSTESTLVPMD